MTSERDGETGSANASAAKSSPPLIVNGLFTTRNNTAFTSAFDVIAPLGGDACVWQRRRGD